MSDYQCLSSSNGDLLAVQADSETAILSVPVQTDTVVPTGAGAGVKATLAFPIPAPSKPTNTGRVSLVGSVAWEVTAAGGAAATGRVNLTLLKNGVAIPNVTIQHGATQALDAIAGPFQDTLLAFVPSFLIDADDVFAIGVELEVVVAGAAGNATVRVHHDPASAGDELLAELTQVGKATSSHVALMTNLGAAGVLEPAASVQVISSPTETDTVIATDGAPGVKATLSFDCRPNRSFSKERVDLLALIRDEVTVAGGAAATGRVNLNATLNGLAIAGVVAAPGTTRALDAMAGPFDELIHLVIPELSMDLNDVLNILVEVELVAAGAAGNATYEVHHDPASVGDELFLEAIDLV